MTRTAGLALTLGAALLVGACEEEEAAEAGPAGPPAAVGLALQDFRYAKVDGRHRYTHMRRFVESAGVAATITRGRICVANGADCVDALVDYPIDAGGTLVQPDHHFATERRVDRITVTYWGMDANGNEFTLMSVVETDAPNARVASD